MSGAQLLASAGMQRARFLGPGVIVGALVLALVGLIMFPMPAALLDVLVALNLLAGALLLLGVLYIKTIVELSTFAILLLVTTIFRLATSVATTRAILSGGDPGNVVRTFGEFVVGGSVAVGLVVFLIIAIVQFIVVTKGAERTAEVAARFTLDAMPGRQLAIEADMRAGSITQEQGAALREGLRSENQIIGSLDGAMRFVKGDSIASMIIVFVNLIGGMAVGVGVLGMSVSQAGRLFSILTIGDGLVAQVPSILSAIAAGIFVTRAGAERRESVIAKIANELSANRTPLAIAAGILFLAGLVPGMPIIVFWSISAAMAAALIVAHRRSAGTQMRSGAAAAPGGSVLEIGKHTDPYLCAVAPGTLDWLNARDFATTLTNATKRAVRRTGIGLPMLVFDPQAQAAPQSIRLVFEGVREADIACSDEASLNDAADAAVEHLVRCFIANFGPADVAYYVQQNEANYPFLKDLAKTWPPGLLERLLQRILMDGASIAHPRPIIQAAEGPIREGAIEIEHVYPAVRLAIVERLAASAAGPDGVLAVRRPPDDLAQLAQSASLDAADVSSVLAKETAFRALVSALQGANADMSGRVHVVEDRLRATFTEAGERAGVSCRFMGTEEIANVRSVTVKFD